MANLSPNGVVASPTGAPYPEKSYLDQLVGKAGLGAYDFLTGMLHTDPVRNFQMPQAPWKTLGPDYFPPFTTPRKPQAKPQNFEQMSMENGLGTLPGQEFRPVSPLQTAGTKVADAISFASMGLGGVPAKGGKPGFNEVIKAAQAGDPDAISTVLRMMKPIIKKAAAPYKAEAQLHQDAMQEGQRTALSGLKSWSPEKGKNLRNYLAPMIRQDIASNVGNLRRPVELPDSVLSILRQADYKNSRQQARFGRDLSMNALAKMVGVSPEVLADAYKAAGRAAPYYESSSAPTSLRTMMSENLESHPPRLLKAPKTSGISPATQENLAETSELRNKFMEGMSKLNPAARANVERLMQDPEKNVEEISRMLQGGKGSVPKTRKPPTTRKPGEPLPPISGGSDAGYGPGEVPPVIKPKPDRWFGPKYERLFQPLTSGHHPLLEGLPKTEYPVEKFHSETNEGPAYATNWDPRTGQERGPAKNQRMLDAMMELVRQTISGSSDAPMAKYRGFQEGFGNVKGFHLYDLLMDILHPQTRQVLHPKGSTVSEARLKEYNIPYEPPPQGR